MSVAERLLIDRADRARRAGVQRDRSPLRRQGVQPHLPHARQPRRRQRTSRRTCSSPCSRRSRASAARRSSRPGCCASPPTTRRTGSSTWRAGRPKAPIRTTYRSCERCRTGPRRRCRRGSKAPTPCWKRRRPSGSCRRRSRTCAEDQRLLVVLRDVEEMSYQEIEEITGLPEGTIKSRLHRARMAIKEWLDRHTR